MPSGTQTMWAYLVPGLLSLLLAVQHKWLVFLSPLRIWECGDERVWVQVSRSWSLSLVSAGILLVLAALWPLMSRRVMLAAGVALLLWAGVYSYLNTWPDGAIGVFFTDRPWTKSAFAVRARLDPTYLLGIALGVWQMALGVSMIRHGYPRPMPGHCGNCGYNLTGNTSGICPECGRSVRNEDSQKGHRWGT